jgi:hypothetical protein
VPEADGAAPRSRRPTQFYFLGSPPVRVYRVLRIHHLCAVFHHLDANIPEETFWYVLRRRSWFDISQIIIFGHFFVPFLLLLRIDIKHMFPIMSALAAWAWLMHYCDMHFNIMPCSTRRLSFKLDRYRHHDVFRRVALEALDDFVFQASALPAEGPAHRGNTRRIR